MSRLGEITAVNFDDVTGRIEVAVNVYEGNQMDPVPFEMPHPAIWAVPSVGDPVVVSGRETGHPTARFPMGQAPSDVGELSQGDIVIKPGDGTKIEMKQSGGSYDVTIESDTFKIRAQDIELGKNGKKLATEDHTHTDSTGGTTSGPDDVTDTTAK